MTVVSTLSNNGMSVSNSYAPANEVVSGFDAELIKSSVMRVPDPSTLNDFMVWTRCLFSMLDSITTPSTNDALAGIIVSICSLGPAITFLKYRMYSLGLTK